MVGVGEGELGKREGQITDKSHVHFLKKSKKVKKSKKKSKSQKKVKVKKVTSTSFE